MKRADANKDGTISAAEIDDWNTKHAQQRKQRILARMDTNKDGAVSQAEYDQQLQTLFNAADTDKDGGVSLDEARKFRFAKRGQTQQEAQPN
jgi:Ca2+-binding EF-hand superfamily protein